MRVSRLVVPGLIFLMSATHVQAQAPKLDEQSASIVDQIERLVTRPNPIAISKGQRKTIDSLKGPYLKAMNAAAASARGGDQMKAMMKIRDTQFGFRDIVRKLMTPSQLDAFEVNATAASYGTKTSKL